MKALHVLTFFVLLFAPLFGAGANESSQSNFIVFLTDDQGWGDLGCYGISSAGLAGR
jgi:hypothetical protein